MRTCTLIHPASIPVLLTLGLGGGAFSTTSLAEPPEDATPPRAAVTGGCDDPFALGEPLATSAPLRLRALAERCGDSAIVRLLYNRAYHAELIEDLTLMAQLHKAYGASDRARLEQGRIFIALVETFAARQWPQRPEVIGELNLAYEQWIRIAELTIGGYDIQIGAATR